MKHAQHSSDAVVGLARTVGAPLGIDRTMAFTSQPHLEHKLAEMVATSHELMAALQAARLLGLRSWRIGAGVIRALVWDALHSFEHRTAVDDVDLGYFDADDLRT